MRLLHVIDRVGLDHHADWLVLACSAFVRSKSGLENVVAVVGSQAEEQRATSLGLEPAFRIFAPAPGWAPPGLRGIDRDRGPFDHVLIWGGLSHSLQSSTTHVRFGWKDLAQRRSRRRAGIIGSWDLAPDQMPLLHPPRVHERHQLRTMLDFDEEETVIIMVGHANDSRAGARLVFTLGLLECAIGPVVGLIPASPGHTGRASRLQRPSGLPSRLRFTDLPEAVAIAAADAAILCPRGWLRDDGAGTEGRDVESVVLATAATMGIPVVLPETPRARSIAEACKADAHFAHNTTNSELARGLLEVCSDRGTRSAPVQMRDAISAADRFSDAIIERLAR